MTATVALMTNETLANAINRAEEYINHSRANNTVKAYRSAWTDFETWCIDHQVQPLPASAETVALYLTTLADAGMKASTLQQRVSAISQAHKMAHYDSPTTSELVHSVLKGIRRTIGTAQVGKAPAMADEVRMMVATLSDSLLGIRDRALLLVGFAGAFRRSELVGLDMADVETTRDGLVITLRHSKTDQEGAGRKVGIPYGSHTETCPVRALQTWLEASSITEGPLFRSVNRHGQLQTERLSDKAVAIVVKRCAEAAGLDATRYAGHSLRAGLATSAAAAGVSERAIMAQTGHKSVTMVRRYIRDGNLFRENAAASVGL